MKNDFQKEAELEQLLSSKSFAALTQKEKEFVLEEIGSEEQYELLRKVSQALVSQKIDLSPDPSILNSLQRHINIERPAYTSRLVHYQMPAYAAVALILISIATTALLSSSDKNRLETITVIKTDTLYLTSKPDTVIVERVVYRYKTIPAKRQIYSVVKSVDSKTEPYNEGVSMKENEELEKLLVTGTE